MELNAKWLIELRVEKLFTNFNEKIKHDIFIGIKFFFDQRLIIFKGQ